MKRNLTEINEVISSFLREDLIRIAEEESHDEFNNFPHACCGTSCDLIIEHCSGIKEEGFSEARGYLPKDEHNDYSSHAWLQSDDYIIDLTAHQFNERLGQNFPEIIVCLIEDYPLKDYLRYKVTDLPTIKFY